MNLVDIALNTYNGLSTSNYTHTGHCRKKEVCPTNPNKITICDVTIYLQVYRGKIVDIRRTGYGGPSTMAAAASLCTALLGGRFKHARGACSASFLAERIGVDYNDVGCQAAAEAGLEAVTSTKY